MIGISFYIPDIKDYWYEQKLEADPLTMSYNAGYDVSFEGYHRDSGCIDFPEERWQTVYDRRIREGRYFAYIKDEEVGCFVGYVNYQYNKEEDRYECGILIEDSFRERGYGRNALSLLCRTAKENGVKELFDSFEPDRGHTLHLFLDEGFEILEEKTWKKFGRDVRGVIVRKIL